jgi:hypothetical protein
MKRELRGEVTRLGISAKFLRQHAPSSYLFHFSLLAATGSGNSGILAFGRARLSRSLFFIHFLVKLPI